MKAHPRAITKTQALALGLSACISHLGNPDTAQAADYQARFTTGAYLSKETFAEALDGQVNNDFLTGSTRIYFRASEMGRSKLDFISDIRDQHDFFDKLDAELLQLSASNTLQVRQLTLSSPNPSGTLYWNLGRFPVSEAGAVNTDGAEVGVHWMPGLRSSIFGGLNPKRVEQSYLTFNSDSNVFGTYTLYQPKSDSWGRYFYLSNAFVAQTVQGHVDRLYWFDNFVYQWKSPSQIVGVFYIDFVPTTKVQTAYLSYLQQFSPRVSTTASVSAIDVIEYSRRQGVLEQLPSSPYREGTLNLRHRVNPILTMDYNLSYGVRNADSLSKFEYSFGPTFAQFLTRHFSAQGLYIHRKNFTANEDFLRAGFGYYSNKWELTLNQDIGYQVESTGNIYHPFVTELGLAHYLSKALYATLSIENAKTERVDILSTFFKIGYRFGTQDVPPLRDGAPPMGRL